MALAKAMGLPTAKAEMIAVADRRVLLVTRYDVGHEELTPGSSPFRNSNVISSLA